MNAQLALDLVGRLPARRFRDLWDAAQPMPGYSLKPGLWLGRNSGDNPLIKWGARRLVGRDYFAKLIFDGWGINVRVRQDGSHDVIPEGEGVRVDLPFSLAAQGLDYGFHIAGRTIGGSLQMRDLLRALPFDQLADVAHPEDLQRVGALPGDAEEGALVLSYIAPLGLGALRGMPFGMVWWRDSTNAERRSADAYIQSKRLFDTAVAA